MSGFRVAGDKSSHRKKERKHPKLRLAMKIALLVILLIIMAVMIVFTLNLEMICCVGAIRQSRMCSHRRRKRSVLRRPVLFIRQIKSDRQVAGRQRFLLFGV